MDRSFLLIWELGVTQKIEWLEDQEEMDERVIELQERYCNLIEFDIVEAIEISVVTDFLEGYKI